MIFQPTKKERIETTLMPGDVIDVSTKGSVCILRNANGNLIPLNFVDHPGVTGYFLKIEAISGVKHEYAWWIARAIASIAKLYVEDCYTLSPQGHHSFPVTDIPPAPTPQSM